MSSVTGLAKSDIVYRMSGGANNGNPANSIGGAISLVGPGNLNLSNGIMGSLWDFVPLSEAQTGLAAEYRCIYAMNNNQNGVSLVNAKLFYQALNTDSQIINMMGIDPAGLNGTAQTIANETTAPINVVFSQPITKDTGIPLGTIPAGQFYPFWLSRQILPNAVPAYQDNFIIRVEGEPPSAGLPPPPGPPGSPPPPPPPPGTGGGGDFGFAAAGKWSCDTAATTNVNNIIARQTNTPPMQLLLAGGDIAYTQDPTCWFNLTSKIDAKTHITFGTMENDTELGSQPAILNNWLHHYSLSQQYYSFDFNDVHFLIMSTEIPFDTSSLQYAFVNKDLIAASANSAIDWIIVRIHQSLYSVGGAGDVNKFNHLNFITTYGQLFETHGVDLVISAHPRNYQRTLPILTNQTSPAMPTIGMGITTASSDYTNPQGIIYINVGTGGRVLDTGTITPQPYTVFTDNLDNGYLYITITQNGSLLKGTFYNISNISTDKFSITHV